MKNAAFDHLFFRVEATISANVETVSSLKSNKLEISSNLRLNDVGV